VWVTFGTALVFRGFVHHFVAGRNLKHCRVGFGAIHLRDRHRSLTGPRVAVFHEHIDVQIIGVPILVSDGDCLSSPAESCRPGNAFASALVKIAMYERHGHRAFAHGLQFAWPLKTPK
jgi:hypothetical protein